MKLVYKVYQDKNVKDLNENIVYTVDDNGDIRDLNGNVKYKVDESGNIRDLNGNIKYVVYKINNIGYVYSVDNTNSQNTLEYELEQHFETELETNMKKNEKTIQLTFYLTLATIVISGIYILIILIGHKKIMKINNNLLFLFSFIICILFGILGYSLWYIISISNPDNFYNTYDYESFKQKVNKLFITSIALLATSVLGIVINIFIYIFGSKNKDLIIGGGKDKSSYYLSGSLLFLILFKLYRYSKDNVKIKI
jgi:hypothetical protein